mgnify:CR=1 FL=1
MTGRIAKNLAEISSTALDLAGGRYPSFVYGVGIRPGQIPVFCFHSAEPDLFEPRLAFLAENGYATLTADEYLSVMRGEMTPPPRAVVLTFDDGWGSLWSIGYPILRKYGLKIVVFLIPGRIERRREYLPNLPDLEDGKCAPQDVFGRDSSEHPLLTWEEIAEMHESGLVDFQSHSYSHSLIARSPRIVDFVNPGMLRSCNLLELPHRARLGEPLYESAPRLSDVRQVTPPARIREECVSVVEAHGDGFFDAPDWRSKLWEVAQRHVIKADDLHVESQVEHSSAVWTELFGSRRLIEEHLPGKEVCHICYPWHVAGRTALKTAQEVGYRAGFMGKVDGRYYNRSCSEPFHAARIGGDFFFRLPGKGRAPMMRLLLGKLARRVRQGSPYLTH